MPAPQKKPPAAIASLLERVLVVRPERLADDDDQCDSDPAHRALDKLRDVLSGKRAGECAEALEAALLKQKGMAASRLAFLLAEYYAREGRTTALRQLWRRPDAVLQAKVLNGLESAGKRHASVLPLGIELALAGLKNANPRVRAGSCSLLMNLCADADASDCVSKMPKMLSDRDAGVRLAATCAVGHLARAGLDLSGCVAGLRKHVRDESLSEYAAESLAEIAKAGGDISAAIPDLVWLLEQPHDYSEPIRSGTAALLQCAKRSPASAKRVKNALAKAKFPRKTKLIERFLGSLKAL